MAETTTTPSTPAAQAAADKLATMRPPMRTVDSPLLEPATPPAAAAKGGKAKAKKPKATGKKRLIKPIGGLVMAFLVFHMMEPKFIKPHYSATHPAANGAIIPLADAEGSSTVTTNLADGHLAQLGISLQMSSVASTKSEAKEEDALMGDTIAILGQQTYNQLLAPSGRAALGSALLHAYQQVLPKVDGAEQVTGIYFTSFVLQ